MALADVVVWAHRPHPLQDLCETSVRATLLNSIATYQFHRMIHPGGCHENMNRAYQTGTARYVVLLDEDIQFLTKTWLAYLISVIEEDHQVGVVGCSEVKDGPNRDAYYAMTDGEYQASRLELHPWLPAFVMLFDRERTPWLEFDEEIPGRKGMTDVDACLQIRAHGLTCVRDLGVTVYHPHKGDEQQRIADETTTKAEEMACFRDQVAYMEKKWGDVYRNAVVTTSIRYEFKNQVTQIPDWYRP